MAALAHNPIRISRKREWPVYVVENPVSDAEKLRYVQIASDFAQQAGVEHWEETKLKKSGRVAEAFVTDHDERVIKSPATTTPYTLYMFLHEASHHFFDHVTKNEPYHVEEYEATKKALDILNENQIELPCKATEEAGWNIEQAIKGDREKGIRIEPKAEELVTRLKECDAVNPALKRMFDRGGYMVLDENGHPVHTDRDLSKTEALQIAKEARKEGEKVHLVRSNPEGSPEQYRLAQAVLSGTARGTGMPVSVAREIVERTPHHLRSEWSRNPYYGDLDAETSMVPAWVYYDSKAARDAAASLYEGEGKKVVLGHSMFGFKEGGGKKWRLRGVDHRGNPKKRPTDVDGNPVPQNYEMLSIRRNQGDALDVKKGLALENIPSVIVEPPTTTFGDSTGNWSVWTPRKTYKRAVKLVEKAYFDRHPERLNNPRQASDDMYESFHGEPSDETIEYQSEEHYHSHLAALGELVELKVKLVGGGKAVIGFEDTGEEKTNNPFWPFNSFTKTTIYHVGTGEKYSKRGDYKGHTLYQKHDTGEYLVPALDKDSRFDTLKDVKRFVDAWTKHQKNPRAAYYIVDGFVSPYIYHVKGGPYRNMTEATCSRHAQLGDRVLTYKQVEKIEKSGKLAGPENWRGWSKNPGPFSEAGKLLHKGKKAVSRPVDQFLGTAGKMGGYLDDQLGRALNPGTDFSLYQVAKEADDAFQQVLEKEYGTNAGDMRYKPATWPPHVRRLAQIKHAADERWLSEMRRKKNPESHPTGPVYLTSNEAGTQLYIVGGDQSLDLPALNITGHEAEKELVYIGHVTEITYHARKTFGNKPEEYDYVHKMGEDGGELPVLNYDRINQKLQLSGGSYVIKRPLGETSPGIEN